MRPSVRLALRLISLLSITSLLVACGDTDEADTRGPSMNDSMMGGHGGEDRGAGHDEPTPVANGARRVEVTADDLRFDPDELTVTAGEDIAIVLTAVDILHDLTVEGLDAHVSAEAGETAVGGLRADRAGTYAYYCSVDGHRKAGMEGSLTVEPR